MQIYRPSALVNSESARDVVVSASLAHPWRLARFSGDSQFTDVTIEMDTSGTPSKVFMGNVQDPGAYAWNKGNGQAKGLPGWRKVVKPRGFTDVRLETVLQWIADQAGARIHVATRGQMMRTYSMSKGTAYQLVMKALKDWRNDSLLTELDGGVLYVGPESACPLAVTHALQLEYGENIRRLEQVASDRWKIITHLVPDLRLLNRLKIMHPLITGTVKVVGLVQSASQNTCTEMEVVRVS
ncbi:hypothetical protein [Deinococcus misasensis]|uniref:hypothetical protein n=1 Tax=Deinococcus misasensis TaxID=392413 RepID=UPI0005557B06|nr:hypothetical protein [Deinococcus misasensis]